MKIESLAFHYLYKFNFELESCAGSIEGREKIVSSNLRFKIGQVLLKYASVRWLVRNISQGIYHGI